MHLSCQLKSVRKMSSDRLREKLLNDGFSEDFVRNMDRETLMQTYAETLSIPSVTDISEQPVASGGYDIDLERERLMLQ